MRELTRTCMRPRCTSLLSVPLPDECTDEERKDIIKAAAEAKGWIVAWHPITRSIYPFCCKKCLKTGDVHLLDAEYPLESKTVTLDRYLESASVKLTYDIAQAIKLLFSVEALIKHVLQHGISEAEDQRTFWNTANFMNMLTTCPSIVRLILELADSNKVEGLKEYLGDWYEPYND